MDVRVTAFEKAVAGEASGFSVSTVTTQTAEATPVLSQPTSTEVAVEANSQSTQEDAETTTPPSAPEAPGTPESEGGSCTVPVVLSGRSLSFNQSSVFG